MQTIREFTHNGDRYMFDFSLCTTSKGFAQLDTSQDAWYFGMWANPFDFKIVNYAEGDIVVQIADSIKEFCDEIRNIKSSYERYGHRFLGIDPGFNKDLTLRFISLGLGDLLH